MKRAAANNDDATSDGDDQKRSKVGDDTNEQDTASDGQPQESALAARSPQQMTGAPDFLGAAAGPMDGEESSTMLLDGGSDHGADEAQQPVTAGEAGREGAASGNISESRRADPQSRSANAAADSTGGESSKEAGAPPHTFDNMEDVDILEYSRDHSGSLTFPEKLMLMLLHIAKHYREIPDQAPTGWVDHGKAFVVHSTDRLCNDWIPLFFRPSKFSSFKRKLFRWEFRLGAIVDEADMNSIPAASEEIVFCNKDFTRDSKHLLSRMKSVTAEKTAEKQGQLEELEMATSGNNKSDHEQHRKQPATTTTSISRSSPGHSQIQQQTNRLVQEPQLPDAVAVGPGHGGGLLHYPGYHDLMHSRQQTLQHGPVGAASFFQQQQQQHQQQGGMAIVPAADDPMARQVLAEAAAKAAPAGPQPGQLLLSFPELVARGGQPTQETAQHQQHNAESSSSSTTAAAPQDQLPSHDCGGASADNNGNVDNDDTGGGYGNDIDVESQQQQQQQSSSRQTQIIMPQQHQQQQQHQATPHLYPSQEEQLQNLLAWQARQVAQLSGAGGPQRQQQHQHNAPSHFGLPGGNPW